MMAFFLTMPISISMPMMAITLRSKPKMRSADECSRRRGGQAGQNGQRVDEALVEDAEHDVDRQHGGEEQQPLVGGRILEDLGGS